MPRVFEGRRAQGYSIYCHLEEQPTAWSGTVQIRTSDEDGAEMRQTLANRCSKFQGGAVNLGLAIAQQAEQVTDQWS